MSERPLATRGGGFFFADLEPQQLFIPELFSEEQRMVGQMAQDFADKEVRPHIGELEAGDHSVTVRLLREAGKLGLLGATVPEAYGGQGLSKVTTALILEKLARAGSFVISFGAHNGIGALPVVLFGNEEQKARYLPAMASGEKLSCFALTEPDAGSDAMSIRATARLSPDGRTYRLNGQKQWITNAGFADLFVVHAKVDGDKMTAFIVERGFQGVSVGPEHRKMGLHGTSTCDVFLSDAAVPVENVLGEIGRGHLVAFNTLNFGRWKIAAGCMGSCKLVLEECASYAQERKQFGRPIAQFPVVQQKLAQMAARTYAIESAVYRLSDLFDSALASLEAGDVEGGAARAVGEYMVEASICKVLGSEAMQFVADEGVQIHGGYGYMHGFEVERAYRDVRVKRIFEGTNEINRLVIASTILRRASRGELPPAESFLRAPSGAFTPAGEDTPLAAETATLSNLKRVALLVAGLGAQKYAGRVEEEQELLLAVGELAILTFALESALLRARALQQQAKPEAMVAAELARLFGEWALEQAETTTRRSLAGMERGTALEGHLSLVRRLVKRPPLDTVALGRRLAQRVLAARGYTLAATE